MTSAFSQSTRPHPAAVEWNDVRDYTRDHSKSGWAYIGPVAKFAIAMGWRPIDMEASRIAIFIESNPDLLARTGFINSAVGRYNEAAAHFGVRDLPLLPTRNAARAAANDALHPKLHAEIKAYLATLKVEPATKENILRRLLGVARRFNEGGWPLNTFREVGDPLRLDALVRSYEKDPGATLSVHVGRKRGLDDVANLLEDKGGYAEEVDAIRDMIACFDKSGLEAAKVTEERVRTLASEGVDDFIMEESLKSVEAFIADPKRTTMWQAQAAIGTLIIKQEACDLESLTSCIFESVDGDLPRTSYLRLIMKAPGCLEGIIDIADGDASGAMFELINGYCRAVGRYRGRKAEFLFERIDGGQKEACTVSNAVHKFWKAHDLDTSPTALRDHVVLQRKLAGADNEEIRDLIGGAYVTNVDFRFRRIGKIGSTQRTIDRMLDPDAQ